MDTHFTVIKTAQGVMSKLAKALPGSATVNPETVSAGELLGVCLGLRVFARYLEKSDLKLSKWREGELNIDPDSWEALIIEMEAKLRNLTTND